MTAAAVVLAEAGGLPTGIPPWMGFAIVVGWLAVVVIALRLFQWRRASRSERRAVTRRNRADDGGGGADGDLPPERQLGPGTDLDLPS